MKSSTDYGNAVRVTFPTPTSPLTKFAKVAAVLTALLSQTETSVTFAAAPANLAAVEIFYGNDIVIPPAVRTVSGVGATMSPAGAGLVLFLSVSAASGAAPTLDCKVQQLDTVSGQWLDVPGASFAQATGITSAALTLAVGVPTVANVSVNTVIRNQYRIAYTVGGTAPSFTFSIGAQA